MRLRQYLAETLFLIEGKLEELTSQLANHYISTNKLRVKASDLESEKQDEFKQLAELIFKIDPTPRKSWRFQIKEWLLSGEVHFPEDAPKVNQELQLAKKFNVTTVDKFNTRASLYEFLENIKRNRGIVDEIFNYTFDIDYADDRFMIYKIQSKDKAEYTSKLSKCTTWCVSAELIFGWQLPYYLLVDKKEKKQYAIVPSLAQFRDSRQNRENSEKRFNEFDKILDLRKKYYFSVIPDNMIEADKFIFKHPVFANLSLRELEKFFEKGISFFQYIDNPTEEQQLLAVKYSPSAIAYIKKPSEKVQVAAIYASTPTLNGFMLLRRPSEDIQLIGVEHAAGNIQFIRNPSEKVQIAAVKKDPSVVDMIKPKASPAVQALAKERGY